MITRRSPSWPRKFFGETEKDVIKFSILNIFISRQKLSEGVALKRWGDPTTIGYADCPVCLVQGTVLLPTPRGPPACPAMPPPSLPPPAPGAAPLHPPDPTPTTPTTPAPLPRGRGRKPGWGSAPADPPAPLCSVIDTNKQTNL